ncbi:DOMON-like domain-containing protein [Sphingomonas sp. ZT3P38]|uniref:DOMON-like domain-containing protein n=1 Tax=Parasphingomonas zepuensis TaxID=3096161 RepID=UPI002FC6C38C
MTAIPTGPRLSPGKVERVMLVPHPDFPSRAIRSISVDIDRDEDRGLQLAYRVTGAIQEVSWPIAKTSQPSEPTDGLWEHSVFEAFITRPGDRNYFELNYTTSLRWALYRFDDYRAGMISIDTPPDATIEFGPASLDVRIWDLPRFRPSDELELNLTAIIEAKDGTKSYWALAHAPGPPDFHNRDCFTARLAAPIHP